VTERALPLTLRVNVVGMIFVNPEDRISRNRLQFTVIGHIHATPSDQGIFKWGYFSVSRDPK
jgi:hypothetical protein